ncbi:hypothetical protein ACFY0A_46360 [Streptomyces sp. NPDC001698]|uniref:hypothetical protein n=1 Tax=Streptomyces sp. NPDC001698 TaxID=3364601 RepID=UPI0036C9D7E0
MPTWGAERTIRAPLLRRLLTEEQWPVRPKGVRLRGVRISGHLDLESATLRCPLVCEDCYFDSPQPFTLEYATASRLTLRGCEVASLKGDSLVVTKELDLTSTVFGSGAVRLSGAEISGQLSLRGAKLTGTGDGLVAEGMKVDGHMFLDEDFTAASAIRLPDAEISGQLSLRGAKLTGTGDALAAEGMKVGGGAFLDEDFTAAGAIRLPGAEISGQLSLRGAELTGTGDALVAEGMKVDGHALLDEDFTAAGAIRLPGAEISGQLSLRGAKLTGTGDALVADRMKVDGHALLDEDFTAAGAIRLPGAEISGPLSLSGAKLTGTGDALVAEGMKVDGHALLDEDFTAAGAIRLPDAEISGQLSLSGAKLTGTDSDGDALVAEGMKVDGGAFLDEDFTAAGAIRLSGAEISGQLSLRGAKLTGTGDALVADRMKVDGHALLDKDFTAAGAIRLPDAEISGQLSLRGAKLTGTDSDGDSLVADWMKVDGGAFLDKDLTAAGAIRLPGAEISGQLSLRGAKLTGTGDALAADRMKVDGDALLDKDLTAAGAIRLPGAEISGQLSLRGAKLTGTDSNGDSLVADRMKVGSDLALAGHFTAAGTVDLSRARIDGTLSLIRAELAGEPSLLASGMHVNHELLWRPKQAVEGLVDLERASVHRLVDDWSLPAAHWPQQGQLRLAGFAYEGFGGEATWEQRLQWIRSSQTKPSAGKSASFASQPYEQLARVYRQTGQEKEAREIAIARRDDLRTYGDLGRLGKIGNRVFGVIFAHGYKPLNAVWWLIGVYILVFLAFLLAQHHDAAMIPAKPTTPLQEVPTARDCVQNYPCFYPAGYAVDVVIPLINVHQVENWRPNGDAPWGWALSAGAWVATGLGWALSTLAVAGYTGLIRKD